MLNFFRPKASQLHYLTVVGLQIKDCREDVGGKIYEGLYELCDVM